MIYGASLIRGKRGIWVLASEGYPEAQKPARNLYLSRNNESDALTQAGNFHSLFAL
jgi:hypothetical protein